MAVIVGGAMGESDLFITKKTITANVSFKNTGDRLYFAAALFYYDGRNWVYLNHTQKEVASGASDTISVTGTIPLSNQRVFIAIGLYAWNGKEWVFIEGPYGKWVWV